VVLPRQGIDDRKSKSEREKERQLVKFATKRTKTNIAS
jgi:hypothetical protein